MNAKIFNDHSELAAWLKDNNVIVVHYQVVSGGTKHWHYIIYKEK